MRIATVIVALAALSGAPAWAQTPADAPVATANGTSAPSTQQQIEAFLAPSADRGLDDRDLDATLEDGPRKIHGVIDLSVGTGGYRSGRVAVDVPIGERGNLALSYGRTESDRGYVHGYPGYADVDSGPLTLGVWPEEGCAGRSSSDVGYRQGLLIDRARAGSDRCPPR